MKRKSLLLCLALVASLAMAISGTLAYLTDTETTTNVMTVGNVDIEMDEWQRVDMNKGLDDNLTEFVADKPLYPAVVADDFVPKPNLIWNSKDVTGVVDKFVDVTNVGSSDAYLRMVLAFEQLPDMSKLHINWNQTDFTWSEPMSDIVLADGKTYTLYTGVYNHVLEADGGYTGMSLFQVYLDPTAENEDLEPMKDGSYTIAVAAQAMQTTNFEEAYEPADALVKAFGAVSAANNPWGGALINPDSTTAVIMDAASLRDFAAKYNAGEYRNVKEVRLAADINLAGEAWTPIDAWEPENSAPLTINGDGHTISNMTVTGESNSGFIGSNARDITIKNLTFENASVITSGSFAGVVIGYQYGDVTLDNVDVKNSVVGSTAEKGIRIGGLVGFSALNDGATLTVKNCDVTNTSVTGFHNVAGLIGTLTNYSTNTDKWTLTDNTVTNCTFNVGSTSNQNKAFVSAFAVEGGNGYAHNYDETPSYFAGNTESGNTYNLGKSVADVEKDEIIADLTDTSAAEATLTGEVDLSGKTVVIPENKNLTVENAAITGNITTGANAETMVSDSTVNGTLTAGAGSTLTIANSDIQPDGDNVAVDTQAGANVTAEGGNYKVATNVQVFNAQAENAVLKINDGVYEGGFGVWTNSNAKVVINGGTFNVWSVFVSDGFYSQNLTITGGTFNAEVIDAKQACPAGVLTITGGTFKADPSKWVPDTHTVTKNGDGTYTVK